jgi:cyclophilin family peptidyl-prolyl cis-trans isomerase
MSEDEVAIVKCGSTAGPFKLRLVRKWSPHGYDRAVELFRRGFYNNTHFFRAMNNFLVQFGITYSDDEELRTFARSQIPDDPQLDPRIKFRPGIISFAGGGDNSRTAQMFFTYGPGNNLGASKWETPIGEVVEGMDNVNNFNKSYGDHESFGGKAPNQGDIRTHGRDWVEKNYPGLSSFEECTVSTVTPGVAGLMGASRLAHNSDSMSHGESFLALGFIAAVAFGLFVISKRNKSRRFKI